MAFSHVGLLTSPFHDMITLETFTTVINQLLPEPHAGLLNGIIFGTKATLSKDLQQALIATGTLHIIALSGMNISILLSILELGLLRIVSRRLASLVAIVIIIGFIALVGPSPSVIRAAIMGSMTLLAIVFGRQIWSLFSWMLAVSIMLLLNPPWIGDLSFQLSALATLGIILFAHNSKIEERRLNIGVEDRRLMVDKTNLSSIFHLQPLCSMLNILYSFCRDDLRVTLSAQVFTLPLIFFQFHRISLISPLSNVLIGWLIPPIMILGFAVAIGGWIWLPLGQIAAWIVWVPLQYVVTTIMLTSRIPFANIAW
ncbi:hypothetical protein A2Z00_05615 [Candidatus Gottesmanbacteria bacterium RBG_13_45_10]|uniref:ComEC/Rec2-related protein domain-containing protein n=1 Tax=Candidatus Gottesmanbacteria bacterium RBG_13_45_10 TaxID=1798370 RepID=A0A1F5ZH35_9BACT|nr:MAG: hypothetical protein A2Z00_05615 [Candidatus Gottesmanbacteria bacterium RBG_13_45_10]